MSMSLGWIGVSVKKMHMSPVSGWNGKCGGTTEFMIMITMGIGAEDHVVKMTSFCFHSYVSHSGKAMIVAYFAF